MTPISSTSFLESLVGGGLFMAMLAGAAACGDIAPSNNGDAGGPVLDAGDLGSVDLGGGFVSLHVAFTERSATAGTLRVDASDTEEWIYVDLDARIEVMPADPLNDAVWDVAFRRFHIVVNGGVSGSGGVTVAAVDGQPFDVVEAPDMAAFVTDVADGEDEDALPDYVFSGGLDPWYAYDVVTHVLSPKARVFVLRTSAGGFVKLAIDDYYDGAGGSGHPTLRYAGLEE
ncbi:MAG: HmuY family protein [Sandaracinaceae bacterium]|jgi:hypothetical protein|nr:HmuY family protein [Sandaracinaceae bacterium]MBK7774858.1 HmuY family protein [Sandaracinaceae bacterium]MBK8411868.1 HmuY family protein [Sandaracinaceae bacterium]MBK8592421.1 HmuY family protein [Sandaracinaceae bacterium]MBP7685311.1 HmuY family protein [Deltaproteobacteria bacterium]